MKTVFKFLIVFTVLSIRTSLYSQNEASKWYFGSCSALDFMTSPPTVLSNNTFVLVNHPSSIADATGNLLFYTNGLIFINKLHNVMANGSVPSPSLTIGERALIARQPGSNTIYYVFTAANAYTSNVGFRYSVVDMSLASGLGSVTTLYQSINLNTTERLTGVLHCNGSDTWILTHENNTNSFLSYKLSASGLNTVAVVSGVGTVHTFTSSQANMRLSPNGKKLAVAFAGPGGGVELLDFDNSTGLVSNPLWLASFNSAFSCEFSPDGTKLYCGKFSGGGFFQWDLCAGSNSAIIGSQTSFTTGTNAAQGLQLAINGKIYVNRATNYSTPSIPDTLGVINSPNLAGVACNYVDNGQLITYSVNSAFYSFPNFITSFFKQLPPSFSASINPSVSCLTASFTSPPLLSSTCSAASNAYTGTHWLFGDPASGAANSSSNSNTSHTFSGPGTYTVKLVLTGNCSSDTLKQTVTILTPPSFTVAGNFTICNGQSTTLTATGADTYSWSNSSLSASVVLSPTSTSVYSVTASNTINACSASKTVSITVSKCLGFNTEGMDDVNFRIYPNPNYGDITVETEGQITLDLFDALGRNVLRQNFKEGIHQLSLEGFKKGLYTAVIICGSNRYIHKLALAP
jgi:PKD repeat protein